jgi:hypothetical protein
MAENGRWLSPDALPAIEARATRRQADRVGRLVMTGVLSRQEGIETM